MTCPRHLAGLEHLWSAETGKMPGARSLRQERHVAALQLQFAGDVRRRHLEEERVDAAAEINAQFARATDGLAIHPRLGTRRAADVKARRAGLRRLESAREPHSVSLPSSSAITSDLGNDPLTVA